MPHYASAPTTFLQTFSSSAHSLRSTTDSSSLQEKDDACHARRQRGIVEIRPRQCNEKHVQSYYFIMACDSTICRHANRKTQGQGGVAYPYGTLIYEANAMFSADFAFLVILVLGVIALFIGMGLRDHNPGILLMGAGFLAVLVAVIKKAIDTFG